MHEGREGKQWFCCCGGCSEDSGGCGDGGGCGGGCGGGGGGPLEERGGWGERSVSSYTENFFSEEAVVLVLALVLQGPKSARWDDVLMAIAPDPLHSNARDGTEAVVGLFVN
jgi:hypothetical protein